MAISKLNSVFARHHRIFFGFLMVLIIFSFLIFTGPGETPFSCQPQGDYGTVYGKDVSISELNNQIRFNDFIYQGSFQNDFQRIQLAYETLCIAAAARERGFRVAEEQIAKEITAMQFFYDNNKFSTDVYKDMLARYGMNPGDFEAALENFILSQKMNSVPFAGIVISEDELRHYYEYMNEIFTVSSISYNYADYIAAAAPTEEEVQEWFDAQAASGNPYMTPTLYSAAAIFVNIHDYEKFVSMSAADMETALLNRYEAVKATKYTDSEGSVKPFAEVKAELFLEVMNQEAGKYAIAALEEFITDVEPLLGNADTRLATLQQYAAQQGFTVTESGSYEENGMPASFNAVPALAAAAVKRTMSSPITPSMINGNNAGIAVLLAVEPARPAELGEVIVDATADCTNAKAIRLATEAADAEIARLQQLTPEERIADVTQENSSYVQEEYPRSYLLAAPFAAEITNSQPGAVTGPVEMYGSYIIFVLDSRTAPAAEGFDSEKTVLENEAFRLKFQNTQQALNEDMILRGCFPPQFGE